MSAIASDPYGCFHCGEPVPAGARWSAVVAGAPRPMCCPGCAAVADGIVAAGLESYYATRERPALRGERVPGTGPDVYDLPAVAQRYVRPAAEPGASSESEASLMIEGTSCSACMWLAERALARTPGVVAVDANAAQRRMRVRWDARTVGLSGLIAALRAVGLDGWPYEPARAETARVRERRGLLLRFAVAALGMMQVMMYLLPVYLTDGEMTPDVESLMRLASLLLTLPVIGYSALPFFTGAWRDLRERRIGMDVPVALGIGSAFAGSVVATFTGSGAVYYDSITMFVCLLLGARWLESLARGRAAEGIERLARAAPPVAERVRADGSTESVAPESLQPGDRVRVRPGAVVPADGLVSEGEGAVDEALLTGEARTVPKRRGDRVLAGAINQASALTLEVTAVGDATRLAGIVRLAERAALARPPAAVLAERAARIFLTALLVVAAGVAVAWSVIDPSRALAVTVAVLVVSCPCALSLATPAAYAAAASAAAARGILVVRPGALETLARATHFVFDKTGTLTAGKPRVIGVVTIGGAQRLDCMDLAAALERDTEHPFGAELKRVAGPSRQTAEAVRYTPGQGIEGTVGGLRLRIGRPEWVAELAGPLPLECAFVASDVSAVALGAAGEWLALFTLADAPRPEARAVVQALIASGAQVSMLSGDRPDAVATLAARLGIAVARGAATPEDKLAAVRALQAQGAVVCMVGDGVNDAATLAQADVSLAMGEGADLAHAAADCVLLSGRLGTVAQAVELARRTRSIVRQNLAWALLYNVVVIPLAAFGWVTPLAAGAGMALSSLAVAANALRLLPRTEGAVPSGAPATLKLQQSV